MLEVVVSCGSMWPRFVVFTFWSFLLLGLVQCRLGPVDLRGVEGSFPVHEEVSVVGLCCRLARLRPRVSRCRLLPRDFWVTLS